MQPAINITWQNAEHYVKWLSTITGKNYRLLTEGEYEYAARAGTQTKYPWGDQFQKLRTSCDGCGNRWDGIRSAPVGSFPPNSFGLFDMVGNVWEWVEDCWHPNYNGAPQDGSAWIANNNCRSHVVRGGSWLDDPEVIRSAVRNGDAGDVRDVDLGLRIARSIVE